MSLSSAPVAVAGGKKRQESPLPVSPPQSPVQRLQRPGWPGCPAVKGEAWEISENRQQSRRKPFLGVWGHRRMLKFAGMVHTLEIDLLNQHGHD